MVKVPYRYLESAADVENSRLRARKAKKEGRKGSESDVGGGNHPRSTHICDDGDVPHESLHLSTNTNTPSMVPDVDALNVQHTELCTSKNNVISPRIAFTRTAKLRYS